MKWVDYREKLNLGFSDSKKSRMLANKISNFICDGKLNENYSTDDYYRFCLMVGLPYTRTSIPKKYLTSLFRDNKLSISESISYYVAFVNSQKTKSKDHMQLLFNILCDFLNDLNIPFEIIWDNDGGFAFPKGAKELDDALVSEPLMWIKDYPDAHKAFVKALKAYSEVTEENASDVADLFRKALETFFQEFFGKDKSLENLKSEYGNFLSKKGVPGEIKNNFEKLLESYTNYNNNYAKHHDKASLNVLEYIMYQTGNLIRLIITLNQEDDVNAD